jgi:hypothetical protein
MTFGVKSKPPLALAIGMVSDAMEVAYAYIRDGKRMTTKEEFEQLDVLAALLLVNAEITKYLFRGMRKRVKGRKE